MRYVFRSKIHLEHENEAAYSLKMLHSIVLMVIVKHISNKNP